MRLKSIASKLKLAFIIVLIIVFSVLAIITYLSVSQKKELGIKTTESSTVLLVELIENKSK